MGPSGCKTGCQRTLQVLIDETLELSQILPQTVTICAKLDLQHIGASEAAIVECDC